VDGADDEQPGCCADAEHLDAEPLAVGLPEAIACASATRWLRALPSDRSKYWSNTAAADPGSLVALSLVSAPLSGPCSS
jgi:hypothetical protein